MSQEIESVISGKNSGLIQIGIEFGDSEWQIKDTFTRDVRIKHPYTPLVNSPLNLFLNAI
jgi:hypothetical protein